MPQTPAILGFDLGGTRSRCVLLSAEGEVLGRGEAGPAHAVESAESAFHRAIQTSRDAAFLDARLTPGPVSRCGFGVAGAGSQSIQEALHRRLQSLGLAPHPELKIQNDLQTARIGAFAARPGILLLAGTGAAALGEDAEGRTARTGGLGAVLDDEGSATSLGLSALRRWVRERDGRSPASLLVESLQSEVPDDADEFIRKLAWSDGMDRPKIAAMAPGVMRAEALGCPVAKEIVDAATASLVQLVAALAQTLDSLPRRVALSGGVIEGSTPFRHRLTQSLKSAKFTLQDAAFDAATGAALIALPPHERQDFCARLAERSRS